MRNCDDVVVLLTLRANGFANLTVMEPDIDEKEGAIARFPLYPNQVGIKNAEKIANALKSWMEHIKTVSLIQD